MPEKPMMKESQRDELKTICQKADVPDKSGELPPRRAPSTSSVI
jgi:hypothetical protein